VPDDHVTEERRILAIGLEGMGVHGFLPTPNDNLPIRPGEGSEEVSSPEVSDGLIVALVLSLGGVVIGFLRSIHLPK
jgi:hypothetical protein